MPANREPDIGTTRPLLSMAIGRALLQLAPEAQRLPILERLQQIDANGWASSTRKQAVTPRRLVNLVSNIEYQLGVFER